MLAESLTEQKIPFMCLKQSSHSPMERHFPSESTFDRELFQRSCEVFTLENEFMKVADLSDLLQEKASGLFPELTSYQHFADKVSQRMLYEKLGLKSPHWRAIFKREDLSDVLDRFTFPFVVKASAGGYDGKGVRIVHNAAHLDKALIDFGLDEGKVILLEEKIRIKKEVAQGFLHQGQGPTTFLPLVDTIQENGVCNFVYYPPQISDEVAKQIEFMLQKLVNFPLVGIFNFEFFIDENDVVYINEGAPRPHNSQHLTIDASEFSQFDLLAMHLQKNIQVPRTINTYPSVMVNILGQSSGADYKLELPKIDEEVQIISKLYGKEKSSPGRKMGHVNIVDVKGAVNLKAIAEKIFEEYRL